MRVGKGAVVRSIVRQPHLRKEAKEEYLENRPHYLRRRTKYFANKVPKSFAWPPRRLYRYTNFGGCDLAIRVGVSSRDFRSRAMISNINILASSYHIISSYKCIPNVVFNLIAYFTIRPKPGIRLTKKPVIRYQV